MKKIKQIGALLSFLFLSQIIFAQAGSTFTNPMSVGSLPYIVTGDSTCGYGDNYTTADIACTGSYMSGDEKIYSFTPTSNIASFNVELTNISDSYSGIYITDDSTTSGNCLGNVGSGGTGTRGVYGVSLVSGTTYYIIVSTWATPQCISSFDINMYSVTCPAPTALGVSSITSTSADLDWTEVGSAVLWQYEYDTTGFTQGSGNMDTTSINPNPVTGLTANTDYDFYVRAICGAGDTSLWAGPYSFFTGYCQPSPSSVDGNGITNVSMDTINNTTGTETNNYGDYSAMIAVAPQGTSLTIDITLQTGYTYNLWAWVDWNDDLDFTDAGEEFYLGESTSANPTTYNASIAIPLTAALGNHRIRLGGADSGLGSTSPSNPCYSSSYGSFEDYTLLVVAPPACLPPSNLVVTNLQSSSVDLGWTENGTATTWDIEYDTLNFTQGTGTMVTGTTSNPTGISGLTPNTTYEFYVRADCGSGSSTWVGPFSFTTLCAPMLAPTLESFDGNTTPSCWSQTATTGGPWVFSGTPGYGAASAGDHTGNGGSFAWMDQSGTDVAVSLISNVIDVTNLTTAYLEFYYFTNNTNSTDTNDLFIEAWDGSAWQIVDSLHVNDGGWTSYGYDISTYTYGTNLVQIRFRAESGGGSGDYYQDPLLDDIAVYEMPTCVAPSALAVTVTSYSTADFSWTENGSATLWDVEYGVSGFTQGTGTIDTTSTNPMMVTGLTAQTDYQFYVKAICGVGDSSAWVGPFAFTTPCAVVVPQYFEPFNSFLPSVCWDQAGSGTPVTGPSGFGSSSWGQSGFPGTGTGGTRVNLYSTGKEEWILTPIFDLSAGGYELKIETLIAAYSGGGVTPMGSDDSVQVLISNDAGATWSAIHTWDSLNAPGNTAGFEYIDLSAYTSATTQFAIWASEGSVNDPEDYYFYVGSFEIRDIPSCVEPIALNSPSVGSTSAVIGWTEQGTASTWESSYGAPGFMVGTGTQNVTTFNPDTITGLAFNTAYEVYVRSVCGAGDSSLWVGPIAINTLPDTISVFPFTNDLESGLGSFLALNDNTNSFAAIDTIAGNASANGVFLTGKTSSGWSGGSTSTTETQAFVDNSSHISGIDMLVDASSLTSLMLDFDVRQSYSYGPKYSWGRVTVNGTQVGLSVNPATANADTFMTVNMDLSAYAGTVFTLSIEHSGKYDSTNYSNSYGDDAFVDNIVLYSPVMATAAVDSNVSCNGMSNGGATVTASEGFAPYTYLWSNADTTASITGLSAGVYSVTVSDSDGDTAIASVTITEPTPVVVSLGNDTSICMGDSVIFNAGTFSAYLWDDASTMAMRTVHGTMAGPANYWVEVTDTNGCTGSDTVVVTVNSPINPDLGMDTAICYTGSVTLDAGTGFTSYSWDDTTNMQTRLVDGATEGAGAHAYFVSTVDINGCTGSDTINVTVDAEIMVDLGNDTTVCNGEKITLDAGAFSSYMWDDNSTMQTRDVVVTTVGATVYDVTVINALGCTGNSSITVTGLAPVIVDLGPDTSIIWFGADTIYTLDAGAGFTGYLWSDGSTNQTNDITVINSGNVIVVVTDANGCTGSDTVLVDFILSVPTFEVASLKMYPNPADDQINIELKNFKNVSEVDITFFSITGEMVLTKHVQVGGNSYFETFDVSKLATGTYFVQFEANGEVITKQFVIK